MPLRYRVTGRQGEFDEAMQGFMDPIAVAGSAAIAEAASDIKAQGRAAIRRAGFTKRWENTFRAIEYPRGEVSANAAALIFHTIPYAEIFESGGVIRGKPLLWLPLPGRPKKLGGKRLTPAVFNQQIGPLSFVPGRGANRPLLVAPAAMSRGKARRRRVTLSAAALRRGARKISSPSQVIRGVPIFVGVRSVNIPQKFALLKIVDRHAGRLAELFVKHLKTE